MHASSKPGVPETPAGRGTGGRQTFALVHALISSGKKPTDAFAAEASTHRSGTTTSERLR